jgi:hypothetical protein
VPGRIAVAFDASSLRSRAQRAAAVVKVAVACAAAGVAGSGRAASPGPLVTIDVTAASSGASLGHYLAYTATIANQAKNTVTHVQLTAPAASSTSPFPLTFVSASPSTGSCSAPPSLPTTCTFGSLPSESTVRVTFVFSSPAALPSSGPNVTFAAQASFDEGPNDQNSSHRDTVADSAATTLAAPGIDFVTGFVPFSLGDQLATAGSLDGAVTGNVQNTALSVPAGSAVGLGAVGTVQEVSHPLGDVTSDCQTGYSCFGQTSFVTMPGFFSATPLTLSFRFDTSEQPPGMNARKLRMFHDGVLVPLCTTPGVLAPGPTCQSSVSTFADKDLGAIVLSSSNGSYRP